MSSVVVRSNRRHEVAAATHAYAERLRRDHPCVRRILWFGSWTNGIPSPGSDVDLCVVVSESDKPPRERVPEFLPIGFPVGLDLFVYTEAEFDNLRTAHPSWHSCILKGREI